MKLDELRDYAVIMANGKPIGTLDRRLNQDSLQVTLPKGHVTLDILVENMGRINFGKYLLQNKKGITKNVLFNGNVVKHWEMYKLPMSHVSDIHFVNSPSTKVTPVFKKASFVLQQVGDTYLDMSHWGKGVVWVNGHNLGRYWSVGPQQTLYLPAEWLKKGNNDITVFEALKPGADNIKGLNKPILVSNKS